MDPKETGVRRRNIFDGSTKKASCAWESTGLIRAEGQFGTSANQRFKRLKLEKS
jgi:hypothetical protein